MINVTVNYWDSENRAQSKDFDNLEHAYLFVDEKTETVRVSGRGLFLREDFEQKYKDGFFDL